MIFPINLADTYSHIIICSRYNTPLRPILAIYLAKINSAAEIELPAHKENCEFFSM